MQRGISLVASIGHFPILPIEFCLEKMIVSAAIMQAPVVHYNFSKNPDIAYVILSTSHMSLHVLKGEKKQSALLDILTCGNCDPRRAYTYLKQQLGFYDDHYYFKEL